MTYLVHAQDSVGNEDINTIELPLRLFLFIPIVMKGS
jgi:hypothetical protein